MVSFSNSFWHEVNEKILSKIKCCRGLSLTLTYCDVIVSFEEEMDLFNYKVILGNLSYGLVNAKKYYLP